MEEIRDLPEAKKLLDLPISYEEKGKEIGKEIGKELGREMGKREVAIEMLKEGLDSKLISKVTHLELEEIEELRKQM